MNKIIEFFKTLWVLSLVTRNDRYRNQMACTTKENIVRCLHKYGVQEIYMPKIDAYDRVVRCPLDENVHWFGVMVKGS